MKIITKQEAKIQGLKFYFTGKPCKRGHFAKRNLRGDCYDCVLLRVKFWKDGNKEKVLEQNKEWVSKNRERVNQKANERYWKNPNKFREALKESRKRTGYYKRTHCVCINCQRLRKRQYYLLNRDKKLTQGKKWREENYEYKKQLNKIWRENNRNRTAYYARKRQAQKLKALPEWVDLNELKLIYHNRPEGHHVDHIIPLQGKIVCGLHVPWNLQYLTAKENLEKGIKC